MDNIFLAVKTIFNWNFQSIASSTDQPFVAKYLRKEYGHLNEVGSDNDDDKYDDDGNSKDFKVVEISTGEALTMFDRLANLEYLSKEERISLVAMKNKLEKSAEKNPKPYQ